MNLRQTRNYLDFLTTNEPSQNNCTVKEEDLPAELYTYLSSNIETKLPAHINEQRLL